MSSNSELEGLIKCVTQSYDYFRENYDRYHMFRSFLYKTMITADDIQALSDAQKPQIEFNVLEALVSRLCGEFSTMEPSFVLRAKDGAMITKSLLATIKVFEAHLRAILKPSSNDNMLYQMYRDLLSGGFSVAEIYVDYLHEMSLKRGIYMAKVADPTLVFWDPMAEDSHKGDGGYCGKMVAKMEHEIVDMFGKKYADKLGASGEIGGFNWSYKTQQDMTVMLCEYYKKKYKKIRIVELSNKGVIAEDEYEEFAKRWQMQGIRDVVPVPTSRTRMAQIPTICRYIFSKNVMLDYKETSFKYFPLVFFDGNSAVIKENHGAAAVQITKPYVQNARDTQKLMNFVGQTLGNEVENRITHKYMAAVEGIPEDYMEAYRNPQHSTTLLYNATMDGNIDKPLPPPQIINAPPVPSELMQFFAELPNIVQMTVGSYDAAQGQIGNKQLSGVAIQNGVMQSNGASMPYNVGMMQGLNRVATIMIDLIPKTYVTPRSIPVRDASGHRSYVEINMPGGVFANYEPRDLEVEVEAGVNFEIQKQVSLNILIELMKASPTFADFINTQGLEVLLDNVDIRGIDALKEQVGQFMKQQQQQAAQQPNPQMMEMQLEQAKVKQKATQAELQALTSIIQTASQNSVAKQANDIAFITAVGNIDAKAADRGIKEEQLDSENARTAVDLAQSSAEHALKIAQHQHDVEMGHIAANQAETALKQKPQMAE